MSYGLKYQGEFDSTDQQRYRVEISQKDYVGGNYPLVMAGKPVVHNWQTDDPKAAIKGSSCVLTVINEGSLPLETFYSTNDDEYKVKLRWKSLFNTSGNRDINVTNYSTAKQVSLIDVNIPLVIASEATKITFNGNTYDITGFNYSGGVNTNFIVADAPLGLTADADYTITYGVYETLFEGFLVQDDCHELMVDYRHEIVLSANDNLGLLKDVALNLSTVTILSKYSTATIKWDFPGGAFAQTVYISNSNFVPVVGEQFVTDITGYPKYILTPTAVVSVAGVWQVTVTNALPVTAEIDGWVYVQKPVNFTERINLASLIFICLYHTNLDLVTEIYCNLYEQQHLKTNTFLYQTYIDPKIFVNNDKFTDCYDVLTKILGRFKLTLFQAYGKWNIVSWDEERRIGATSGIRSFIFDKDFFNIGSGSMDIPAVTGLDEDTYPEVGLQKSITRPYNFDKETFNYHVPVPINNYNLQKLGSLDHTLNDGTYTYDFYNYAPDSLWQDKYGGSSKIVVKTDIATGNEVERYISQAFVFPSVAQFPFTQFNGVEVTKNDKMRFNIKIRSDGGTGGANIIYRLSILLRVIENDSEYYALADNSVTWGHFTTPPFFPLGNNGVPTTVLAGNTADYTTLTFNPDRFPKDGILYIRLVGSSDTNGSQPNVYVDWKDIDLTIENTINDSTKVIGHIHTNSQDVNIKNNNDQEVYIDDSPRNTIGGTLFLPTFLGGIIQDRTALWYRDYLTGRPLERLGSLMTFEQLFLRRIPRKKMEGVFYGLVQGGISNQVHISMLSIIFYTAFVDINFVFGSLSIDYRNNNCNNTLWQLYKPVPPEADSSLANTYTFNYIYGTNTG